MLRDRTLTSLVTCVVDIATTQNMKTKHAGGASCEQEAQASNITQSVDRPLST